jgi:hypothetical protein
VKVGYRQAVIPASPPVQQWPGGVCFGRTVFDDKDNPRNYVPRTGLRMLPDLSLSF